MTFDVLRQHLIEKNRNIYFPLENFLYLNDNHYRFQYGEDNVFKTV